MTTLVTVETFERGAKVQRVNPESGAPILGVETLPPNSKSMFYLTEHTALAMQELPNE